MPHVFESNHRFDFDDLLVSLRFRIGGHHDVRVAPLAGSIRRSSISIVDYLEPANLVSRRGRAFSCPRTWLQTLVIANTVLIAIILLGARYFDVESIIQVRNARAAGRHMMNCSSVVQDFAMLIAYLISFTAFVVSLIQLFLLWCFASGPESRPTEDPREDNGNCTAITKDTVR